MAQTNRPWQRLALFAVPLIDPVLLPALKVEIVYTKSPHPLSQNHTIPVAPIVPLPTQAQGNLLLQR